ncbi:MAG: sporulation protein YqfD [Clostridia bacterium]|nr:sporulation protein YqfD [Clostridia bacterium]
MRQDKDFFAGLGLYTDYRYNGRNIDPLVNYCGKKGLALFNVRKTGEKVVCFSIKYRDNKKFFAITKELCYNNITKEKDRGLFYPFLYLLKNFGILIGAIVFILTTIVSNDFIYSIEYSGSGEALKTGISEYLSSVGVEKFTRFSSFDFEKLEDEIVAANPEVSFAGIKKEGNVLKIRLESAVSERNIIKRRSALYSDADGVIEYVKVYGGTAVLGAGDRVKKGDLIVGGYALIKETVVPIEVLATVSVIVTEEFIYVSPFDNDGERAEILAGEKAGGAEIVATETEKSFSDGEYIYKVKISFRHVI